MAPKPYRDAFDAKRLKAATMLATFVTLVMWALVGCAHAPVTSRADTLDAIRARGELVWGGDMQGGEPYVFEDPDHTGVVIGFEVDIANAIAHRLGVRARFQTNDWSTLVPSLERGDFDVAMNGLEDTPERRARVLLSRPYFAYVETLAVRRGSGARSLDDMRGKRVGTLNQTYAWSLLGTRPEIERVPYEGQQEPYADLAAGRIDGVLLESIIADRYGCGDARIECVRQEALRGTYVIGIRRGDDRLKTTIDEALGAMMADGELRAILEKWKLWDDAQARLATETPEAAAPPAQAAPARSLTAGQIGLFFQGALFTLAISIMAFGIAVPLGMLLALARVDGGAVLRGVAGAYVEIFRGTPVLLQLYVLYYGLAPIVKLSPIVAAVVGLGLNYAAYEAEVFRGAILAIPIGQSEAASALGLTRVQALRHVILPQAFRHALPAMTNDLVSLLKDSSLVSVLTVVELTKRMTIAAVEIRSWAVPGLLCAALYFAMSFPLARFARHLERRLGRDPDPRAA